MNQHLETLLAQHREMRALAATYEGELDRATPDLAALGRCRWTLTRLVITHIAFEGMHLYPALNRCGGKAATAGARIASETGQLTDALGRHVREWTGTAIEANWPKYRRESRLLVRQLCARMDREEAELYPALKAAKTA